MNDKDLYVVIAEMLRKQDQQAEILERIDSTLNEFMGLSLKQFEQQLKFNENFVNSQDKMGSAIIEHAAAIIKISSTVGELATAQEKLSTTQEKLSINQEKLSTTQEKMGVTQEKMSVTQEKMANVLDRITEKMIADNAEIKDRLANMETRLR